MSVTVPILDIFTLARELLKLISIFPYFIIILRTVCSLTAGRGTTDEGTDGQREKPAKIVST